MITAVPFGGVSPGRNGRAGMRCGAAGWAGAAEDWPGTGDWPLTGGVKLRAAAHANAPRIRITNPLEAPSY